MAYKINSICEALYTKINTGVANHKATYLHILINVSWDRNIFELNS